MLSWWFWLWCLGIVYLENTVVGSRSHVRNSMNVVYKWKYMDYDFDSKKSRQAAIKSGDYNRSNCFPIDVDRWHDKTFVTVIRDQGVPSSLNIVSRKNGPGGPLLRPYPDWRFARIGDCSGITSVYRVAIDRCDRLWVLDTGVIGQRRVCPAQLLTFDLHTSKLTNRVKIPDNIATNSTTGKGLLITPVVKTFGQDCRSTIVYISDVEGYGLIVYDGKTFRRLTSSALVFDPKATKYTIEGESFELEDGIVGMALSPLTENLYFSPMSSYNLGFVDTRNIDQGMSSNDVQYRVYNDILWTQSSAKAISRTGALFFGLVNDTSIGCWNEYKHLSRENIDVIAKNPLTLQFISGMKIREHYGKEHLWALSNRYQKIAAGTINFDEINFRILKANVFFLIRNSRCCKSRPT